MRGSDTRAALPMLGRYDANLMLLYSCAVRKSSPSFAFRSFFSFGTTTHRDACRARIMTAIVIETNYAKNGQPCALMRD